MDNNTLLYFLLVVEIIHIIMTMITLGLVLDLKDEAERSYIRR